MEIIKQLPPILANQIAAGEVVERPSSVVKELLENSIDANSTRIQIDIENGGLFLIRIRDDGTGITKQDLSLALARHATSKIYTHDDLYQISSLGFRGEALASIASVSRLTMLSKHQSEDVAWQIKIEGKDLTPVIEPAAHPKGTTIEVANLFYNVPARRKFLRSSRTEFIHIEEIVRRLALANFHIGFTLKHNDKVIFNLNPIKDMSLASTRLAKTFDKTFVDHAIYFEKDNYDMKLHGWFVSPEVSRSQSDQQYFYINGRIIRDKVINHAMRQAWQQHFPEGRYPSYVIYLDIPYAEVDVNVHPTKHEVRFRQSRLVHDFVHQVLSQVLSGQELEELTTETEQHQTHKNSFDNLEDLTTIKETEQTSSAYSQSPVTRLGADAYYERELPTTSEIKEHHAYYNSLRETDVIKTQIPSDKLTIHLQHRFERYCLALIDNDYYFVNLLSCLQHQIKLLANHAGELKSPPLLLPITVNIEKPVIPKLELWQSLLEKCGIDYSAISESSIAIRKLPKILNYIDWESYFSDLAGQSIDIDNLCHVLCKHVLLPEDNAAIHSLLQMIAVDMAILKSQGHIKLVDEALINKLF